MTQGGAQVAPSPLRIFGVDGPHGHELRREFIIDGPLVNYEYNGRKHWARVSCRLACVFERERMIYTMYRVHPRVGDGERADALR